MRAQLLVLLLFGMTLAGCLTSEPEAGSLQPTKKRLVSGQEPKWELEDLNASLSKPIFPQGAILAEDHWHTSFDGTKLHSRIYRPADRGEWLSPIILHVSPYFGPNSASNIPQGNGLDGWLVSHFVQRGYAVVLNDVRGTGESGGCLEQTGPKQTQDEYIVIEDLATMPWANGRVGMIGISYDGETQQSAAVAAPPHLTTIIPSSSVAGQYEWNFYDGIPYTINGLAGMVAYTAIHLPHRRQP
jgi:putative CocE/NonD family hydrolase